ncbi:MAG: hypothetical protein ACTSYY_09180 [Promethearchaeota archaeon]
MIANITYHIFDNFPNNIPDQIINNFEQFIDEFPEKKGTLDIYAKKAKKIKKEIISSVNETDEADTIEIKKIGQALDKMPTFWRILTTGLLFLLVILDPAIFTPKSVKEILSQDIQDTILSQQLFSMIAQLEVFIIESMKIICKSCPEKLKRRKAIEYQKNHFR